MKHISPIESLRYQLARIEGELVAIGDSVQAAREADGVWFFIK